MNRQSMDMVTDVVKSILVASKNAINHGMTIPELKKEYSEQEGREIPFRALGYPCMQDFLEALQRNNQVEIGKRNSVTVVYPCINKEIAHVSKLVSRQKSTCRKTSRGGKRLGTRSTFTASYHFPILDSDLLTEVVKRIKWFPQGVHISDIMQFVQQRVDFTFTEENLIRQLREVSQEVAMKGRMIYPVGKKPPQASQPYSSAKQASSTDKPTVQLNQNQERCPTAVTNGDTIDPFEVLSNARFSSKSADSTQGECSRQSLTDNTNRENVHSRENGNYRAGGDEYDRVSDAEEDWGMLVKDRTKFRLEKLVQQRPEGIWCAELPDLYLKEYGLALNYEDLGFSSVSAFAAYLPEIFHCVRLQDKGDFKLFHAKTPKPETKRSERPGQLSLAALHNIYGYDEDMEALPAALSPLTSEKLIPDGVMTEGETVAQISVSELFPTETACLEVVVVEVITPTFFWIQLLKRIPRFQMFMTQLHEYYTEHAKKYVIPIVLLVKGLNCACLFDNRWHRGIIKTVKPDNTVTVLFYDYGTVQSYPPQAVHFLHRLFSSLPAQAIPCGLYNVKPKSGPEWPYSACRDFVNRVIELPLMAMMGSIDVDNNSMLIALTDTEGDEDLHVNDWMVSKGHAVFGKMGDSVNMNETRDDSEFMKDANTRVAGLDAESLSLISSLLGVDLAALGATGLSKIAEESSKQNSTTTNPSQTSPQLMDIVIQQARTILAMESWIKLATARGILSNLIPDASGVAGVNASKTEAPSFVDHQAELNGVIDSLKNMTLDDQTHKKEKAGSVPPSIAPKPKKQYIFAEKPGERSTEYSSMTTSDNYNVDNVKEEVRAAFRNFDVNMNFTNNPFHSSPPADIERQLYQPESPFASFNEPYANSSRHNDSHSDFVSQHNYLNTHQNGLPQAQLDPMLAATSTPREHLEKPWEQRVQDEILSHSPFVPQQNFANAPQTQPDFSFTTPPSPRESFEKSLEQSAKDFFERIENPKKTNRNTNPFLTDFARDKFHRGDWPFSPSGASPFSSGKNPFLEDEVAEPPRVVYEVGPVVYNLGKHEEEKKLDESAQFEWSERELFKTVERSNVGYLPAETFNANRGAFANPNAPPMSTLRWDPPPLPPRPNSMNSNISNGFVEVSTVEMENRGALNLERTRAKEDSASQKKNMSCAQKKKKDSRANIGRRTTMGTEEVTIRHNLVNGSLVWSYQQNGQNGSPSENWTFTEVQLTKQDIYLLYLDDEGWIFFDEALQVFTNYVIHDIVIKILEIQNANIPMRTIKRRKLPNLFAQIERAENQVINDVFRLVPVKSILKFLRKLNIVDMKELELARTERIFPEHSSALFDACNIIGAFARLRQDILTSS